MPREAVAHNAKRGERTAGTHPAPYARTRASGISLAAYFPSISRTRAAIPAASRP